jgi:hypothetical protein
MSERKKLEQNWELRTLTGEKISPATMITELGKLVAQCPHNRAHWIQEITREGVFSSKLLKRCYLCGYNIDELDVESGFVEQLLTEFDMRCEARKKLEETEKK